MQKYRTILLNYTFKMVFLLSKETGHADGLSKCWNVSYRWNRPHVTYTNWALFRGVAVSTQSRTQSRFCLSESLPRVVIFLIVKLGGGFLPAIVCVCIICLQYISYYLFLCRVIIWTSPWPQHKVNSETKWALEETVIAALSTEMAIKINFAIL